MHGAMRPWVIAAVFLGACFARGSDLESYRKERQQVFRRALDAIVKQRRAGLTRSRLFDRRSFRDELEQGELAVFGKFGETRRGDGRMSVEMSIEGTPATVWPRVVMALEGRGWTPGHSRAERLLAQRGIRLTEFVRGGERVRVTLIDGGRETTSRVVFLYEEHAHARGSGRVRG